jgi:hypothetical protein
VLEAVNIKGDVNAGPGCFLLGVTVTGNLTVEPGGRLFTQGIEPVGGVVARPTVIKGNVESSKATVIELGPATSVGGSVHLTGTTEANRMAFGKINGNVEIEGGIAHATVGGVVGGNVQIRNNSGAIFGEVSGVTIREATVGGKVELANNSLTGSLLNFFQVIKSSVAGNLLVSKNSEMGGRFPQDKSLTD